MKLHPRYFIVQKADLELSDALLTIIQKHDLTHGETTKLLASQIINWNKYAIRDERHPDDPEKKGDEE